MLCRPPPSLSAWQIQSAVCRLDTRTKTHKHWHTNTRHSKYNTDCKVCAGDKGEKEKSAGGGVGGCGQPERETQREQERKHSEQKEKETLTSPVSSAEMCLSVDLTTHSADWLRKHENSAGGFTSLHSDGWQGQPNSHVLDTRSTQILTPEQPSESRPGKMEDMLKH